MRSCTNSAFVNGGISKGASSGIDPSCGPQGPAPPSLSHLESDIWRCSEESEGSDFLSGMKKLSETREEVCLLSVVNRPASLLNEALASEPKRNEYDSY